jgi:two-component system response regulator YesN
MTGGGKMYQVLIAEDNKAIQRNLEMLVKQAGEQYHVTDIVGNGMRALEALNRMEVDIIITDIRMPVMDGLELIRKASAEHKNLQYIIVSGYDEFDYARAAITLGVSEYLLKPIKASDMEKALDKVSEKIRSDKEKNTPILSVEQAGKMVTPWKNLAVSEDVLNSEIASQNKLLMPLLLEWNEEHYTAAVGEIIDGWFEKGYSREALRILLLNVTELTLQSKGLLGTIDMIQPVENILMLGENYLTLKQAAVGYFSALFEKINAMLLENRYSADQLLQEMKKYLDSHIYGCITAGELAEKFHISPSYANRLFRKYLGLSPIAYYNQQKMKEACRLLSDDREHKVKDISEALGFQNQQYFSHAFRAFSGYTPLEYKEKNN